MKFFNPGDHLWFVVPVNKYAGDIIVPVVIQRVSDIYTNPTGKQSWWGYRFLNESENYVSIPTTTLHEDGYPIYESKPFSFLGDLKPVNQYVWIDEPVGHGIQVDGCDGLFETLQEAQRYARPSKKKHLKRSLKNYRKIIYQFIANTWERNGAPHPGFTKLPIDKKIYVRKK